MVDSIAAMTVTTAKQEVFSATSIAVGTSIVLENIGNSIVYYAAKATEPTNELAGYVEPSEQATVTAGEAGVWVWTIVENSRITVQEL
jgi:hypothetical protein